MKTVKIKTYPYAYARVSAMMSKLITKSEYHKLLKMNMNDIIKYLEEYEYKNEIDKLAMDYSGTELIEQALNLNLVNTFKKLKRISDDEVRLLIESYLTRWDFYNLKTILRAIYSKADREYTASLLVPAGSYDKSFFINLLKKGSIEDVLKNVPFMKYKVKQIKEALDNFKKTNNLIEIENILDRIYYKHLLKISFMIPKKGFLFKNFIKNEIDILNIKIILRLKREGFKKEDTLRFLIFEGAKLNKKLLEQASNTKDIEELRQLLSKTHYKSFFDRSFHESFIDVELALDNFLIKKSTLSIHQHPLTISAILSYMFFKEIEVKNLKILIKAKQLGIDEDVIENKLLVKNKLI
jgi:V/A-type H+-transporting ATPase subunit C